MGPKLSVKYQTPLVVGKFSDPSLKITNGCDENSTLIACVSFLSLLFMVNVIAVNPLLVMVFAVKEQSVTSTVGT